MHSLTITKPDDWHLHLRDGTFLDRTVKDAAERYARAIIMPNLKPPVVTSLDADAYYQRIGKIVDPNLFQPLMTLYLTQDTKVETIVAAHLNPHIQACKLYPAHATTNAEAGVHNLQDLYPIFAAMQNYDLPLLVHGEAVGTEIDIFDREKFFLEKIFSQLIKDFPALRVVLEHITTKDAVDFIQNAPSNVAATITAHHLLLNRNDLFHNGINPHHYCLPILKREKHQRALIAAATSGNAKFFLGSDSAPHAVNTKECQHGCAGIYTGFASLELYAEVFESANALHKLETFASFNGADFYKLPRNSATITLIKKPWRVPKYLSFGEEKLIPFRAGEEISWRVADAASRPCIR